MLELYSTQASLVLCAASPEGVDAAVEGGEALRVAPDEALFPGPPGSIEPMVASVRERVEPIDDDAVVLDATDGWAIWTLEGGSVRDAFAHLSALELPEDGFVQGEVARVPVKVAARGDQLHLFVPAMWGAHLHARILADCSHLGIRERPDPVPWVAPRSTRRKRT